MYRRTSTGLSGARADMSAAFLPARDRVLLLVFLLIGFAGAMLGAIALYHITQHDEPLYLLLKASGILLLVLSLAGQGWVLHRRAKSELSALHKMSR